MKNYIRLICIVSSFRLTNYAGIKNDNDVCGHDYNKKKRRKTLQKLWAIDWIKYVKLFDLWWRFRYSYIHYIRYCIWCGWLDRGKLFRQSVASHWRFFINNDKQSWSSVHSSNIMYEIWIVTHTTLYLQKKKQKWQRSIVKAHNAYKWCYLANGRWFNAIKL